MRRLAVGVLGVAGFVCVSVASFLLSVWLMNSW